MMAPPNGPLSISRLLPMCALTLSFEPRKHAHTHKSLRTSPSRRVHLLAAACIFATSWSCKHMK
ncbi:hypothetical protein BX666DRAFT_759087 [Dichotomocladium elegans]|nr:hypothetical protein BX666DRAFT_759087 [Dichotomocladium elegans]